MSRSAPERWPISSVRSVKSGISARAFTLWRTRSAAEASRCTGPAMVLARIIDSTTVTAAANSDTRTMPQRSAATILSMSPPRVESSSTPSTARMRCTGTATETTSSPFSLTRTMGTDVPVRADATSG